MKATLDHIGIAVGDIGAALAFYRRAAGGPAFPSRDAATLFRARPYRGTT